MSAEHLSKLAKIALANDDYSFSALVKSLFEKDQFATASNGSQALRVKKAPVKATLGSRFKSVELEFFPHEGLYTTNWNGNEIFLHLERGQHVLTTECRQIDYLKYLTVYGESVEMLQNYLQAMLVGEDVSNPEEITIYENNNGYWNVSKQKRPRKLESVIFKQDFVDSVIGDIQEFIESQEWYEEMGIPYKRSYLLYGPPGTGKSSFAQALAGYIGFSICFVNCSDRVNDFQFNSLLNKAPKQSIILIEDVDAIFSERKNTEKNNQLTFSGFLNAIDGVRSQEGRILVMTTNYKERLDPALLRPGRVDELYEISYATHYQIEKLCYRFFKNQKLASEFAKGLPEHKFSMSMIQGFLLKYRKNPDALLKCLPEILESDENVKMDRYLTEINCLEVLNDFKIEECYSLANARNLPKDTLEKMISKLSPLKKGRLLETVRMDRKLYLKSHDSLVAYIEQNYKDEEMQRSLNEYLKEGEVRTFYQIRDKAKEIEEQAKGQEVANK